MEDKEKEPTKAVPAVNATVAFVQQGTLKLAPGEQAQLTVVTTPPEAYAISFRLVGDSREASLDRSSAVADAQGRATVALKAPKQATTFAVRATIKDGPSADLVVSVSGLGFATLDVKPTYSGNRPVTHWYAAAVSGTTCAALSSKLPADLEGALKSQAATWQPLLIEDAPVGPALAVVVRAAYYAWGCTDVSGLAANATSKVDVQVANKPIDVTQSKLDLSLVFSPEPEPYKQIVTQHLALMTAVFGGKTDQPAALLAAMAQAAPDKKALDAAADKDGWLAKLQQHWSSQKVDVVAKLEQLGGINAVKPPVIKGQVKSLGDPSHALFTLKSIGPLLGADAAAPSEYLMNISVDPDDSVHLGGTLFMMPSRFLGSTISSVGMAMDPTKKSFAELLAATVVCDKLDLPGLQSCTGACIASLCTKALGLLWEEALDASAANSLAAQIPMNASGAAKFSETALLTGFTGTWLGQLSSGKLTAKVTGAAEAAEIASPPM
jgi:hypothetical protein